VSGARLTPLQERVLRTLAALTPPWTLTGGAALTAVHLGHRGTRDLDLFWRQREKLGDLVRDAVSAAREDGLQVETLRTAPAFAQLRVEDGREVCMVDLVAEPFGPIEPPQKVEIGGAQIAVDSAHEILVNKLTTLLNRSELRDLVDVKGLLDAGGDLDRAIEQAPQKDGGFSPLTLAWVLKDLDPEPAARALGWDDAQTKAIAVFLESLVQRLTAAGAPDQ